MPAMKAANTARLSGGIRRLATRISLFAALLSFVALAASAGEKTATAISGLNRRYGLPPVVIGGKTLSIVEETAEEIRYSAPFGSRSSICRLAIGGGGLAEGLERTIADYRGFCAIKGAIAAGVGRSALSGGEEAEEEEILHEDRLSIIVARRWREGKARLFAVEGVFLIDNLPLRLFVGSRDGSETNREKGAAQDMKRWIETAVRQNPRIPQRLDLERHFIDLEVPIPSGYDRLLVPDGSSDGLFFRMASPALPPVDGSVPFFSVLRLFERDITGADAFARLVSDLKAGRISGLAGVEMVGDGRRHCLVRADDGKGPALYDFVFVKSRLLILCHRAPSPGPAERRALDDWRRQVLRDNGEVPE